MDEDAFVSSRDASDATHRILQKSTGKEIGKGSVYPKYIRRVDTMNTQLVHCDKLNVIKNPRSKEMFIGSNESSQLQQDLYLTDSEDEETDDDDEAHDNKELCDDVDEETKNQARLVEEMIVDESQDETSFEDMDLPGSSKSAAATPTNSTTTKLTTKSFYEEVDGQENVSDRKKRKVRCKLCKVTGTDTLISISNISTHIRNLHEQKQSAKCPHCDKNFNNAGSLDFHIRHVHKGDSRVRVRCPHCDKELAKSSLRKHIKNVHRSVKGNTNCEKPLSLTKSSHESSNRDLEEDVGESATVSGSPPHDQETSKPPTVKEDVRKFHVKVCNDAVASAIRESPRRKRFKCDLCLKEFLLSRGLKSHQKRCPSA